MSGSAPRLPTRMTLLTPPAMTLLLSRTRRLRLVCCSPEHLVPTSQTYHGPLTTGRWRVTTSAMFRALRVGVVIPAFNESRAIATTVSTLPAFVDDVIVVDDAS